jgi:glycosyltransferase A (GT-A) superfamily protein (DUF2064 family)
MVKTRLCPPCTPSEAATIAEAALADTLGAVASTAGAGRRVLVLQGSCGPWLPPGFEVIPQCPGGLDRRLAAALSAVGGPVLLLGMDTPQVDGDLMAMGMDLLGRRGVDAVLGLASDGGWWGIGLRRPDPRAFLGVPMSRSFTGRAQARRLSELGLRWSPLPILQDVDRFSDAIGVADLVPRSRFAIATRDVLVNVVARGAVTQRRSLPPTRPMLA